MTFRLTTRLLVATSALALLTACDAEQMNQPAGAFDYSTDYGEATRNNYLVMTGQRSAMINLSERFNREVPDTINFAFNSTVIDGQARQVLNQQVNFIRQFPEVTFRVYGHTDAVGSDAYNRQLGLRRAQAVVAYFAANGISRSRLEATVTYGETQPVVATQDAEVRNRRTVTEVSGFVKDDPLILNGKYAEVIFREYVNSAVPPQSVQGGLGELTAGASGG